MVLHDDCDLFLYLCQFPEDLLHLMSIKGWRERSKRTAVFLYETWSSKAENQAIYFRLLDEFDHVFLFNPSSVAAVERRTRAPCTYMPAGCDTLFATPYPCPGPRPIDVFGMGRTDQEVHAQLLQMTHDQQLFYIWEPWGMTVPPDGYAVARARTYHLIRSTRLFTSFNFASVSHKSAASQGEEAIPARVFEGAAGGAVLLGTAPPLSEFRDLFDWPDALIEIPMEPVDMPAVWSELSAQPVRLRRASILNAAQSLRRHDWAYRFETMLAKLDLPLPAQLVERKAKLATLAARAETDLLS